MINMIDFKKLNRVSYISKRMYIIKDICELNSIELEYLFGLLNLFNSKNRGTWFWQKATMTGVLKDNFESFDKTVDGIVKDIRKADEKLTEKQIKSASDILVKLLDSLEYSCNVDRKNDHEYVIGFLDKNLKNLIDSNLEVFK